MMPFENKTPDEIRAEMDRLYAAQAAYPMTNRWDADRMRRIREVITHWVGVLDLNAQVLDVGCGDGSGIVPALLGAGANYLGIDVSAVAVAQASAKHPTLGFRPTSIEAFESTRRFDLVIAIESIEHWADAGKGLDVIAKHLREGGRFLMTTPNRDSLHHRIGRKLGIQVPMCSDHHVREFGFEELKGLLDAHGFEVIESVGVGLMPYWALESAFGMPIRNLTDTDPEVIEWLGEAGTAVPHLAFIQCHECVLKGTP